MAETYNKKEREKKKALRRKEKELKREARKDNETSGSLDSMMAYVDHNGMLRDTPPDPSSRAAIKADDIELGVPTREKEEIDPILEGVVNFYDSDKGYGFIKCNDENIFVHYSNVTGAPQVGSKVKFEKEKGPKGWVAVRVMVI